MENVTFEKLPQAVQHLIDKVSLIESSVKELNPLNVQDQEVLFTIEETADFLSCQVSTIRSRVSSRSIPFYKVGKRLYFVKSDLIKWVKIGNQKTLSEINQDANNYIKGGRK